MKDGIFRVVSYNLFKGRTWMSLRSALPQMGDALRAADPDLLMLQEIRGFDGPRIKEGSVFSQGIGLPHFAYGRNYVGKESNHGNAIYSRYPLAQYENIDLSLKKLEKRGILSSSVSLAADHDPLRRDHPEKILHIFTTHLDLAEDSRRIQFERVADAIERIAGERGPGATAFSNSELADQGLAVADGEGGAQLLVTLALP